jgi:hypothetical protein
MYAIELASSGLRNIRRFTTISSGIQIIFRSWPQQFETLQHRCYRSQELVKPWLRRAQVALCILWRIDPFLGRELE